MKFEKIAIFITLFSLWLTNYFSGVAQEFVAFTLIFSVGILHGSNDLSIMGKLRSFSGKYRLSVILGSYVFTVLVAGGLFYLLPELALIVFLLFSAFHFGEQHWERSLKDVNSNLRNLYYLSYGSLILFLLFHLNATDTQDIILSLSGQTVPVTWFLNGGLISGVLFALLTAYLVARKKQSIGKILFELFLLVVFGIVFNFATLIWAFAIYFIYWHSIPSIFGQLKYLYGEISVNSMKKYIKSSSLIWVISVSSMLVMIYIFRANEQLIMPLFFAFLGAITFAHSFIITKMFRQ